MCCSASHSGQPAPPQPPALLAWALACAALPWRLALSSRCCKVWWSGGGEKWALLLELLLLQLEHQEVCPWRALRERKK